MKINQLFFLLVFPIAACATEPMYLTKNTSINSSIENGYLGTVSVLTPVDVLQKKGDFAKIKLQGWSLKEYPSQIFSQPGIRIEYGSFDEEKAVKAVSGGKTVVVQDNPWIETTAEGWVPLSLLTSDRNKLLAEGKADQQQKCSVCHPAPAANHFTANQWASILPLRGGRTGHTRAKSNALLFKYLQLDAKQ